MTETKWDHPHDLSDSTVTFPCRTSDFMPAMDEIPAEFKRYNGTPWNRWQSRWFFEGLSEFPEAKDGIDREAAARHLKAIQGSFEPAHEHKEAAVAWLASLWLREPTT